MKRILTIAIIAFLLIFGYSKYRQHQRFNPPSNYDYEISEEIDVNYHNKSFLQAYYDQAHEVGQFARSVWSSERIDVLFPDSKNASATVFAQKYQELLTEVQQMEGVLKRSAALKALGLTNDDIETIETTGLSVEQYRFEKALAISPRQLKMEDTGQLVFLLQKYLAHLGYDIPQDGIFKEQTYEAVIQFQEKQGLFPSGVVDPLTFQKIYIAQP